MENAILTTSMVSPVHCQPCIEPRRVHALDGLRGALALVVLAHHVCYFAGSTQLDYAAAISVFIFFILSGYVLTRAYDSRYFIFLARRAVRLWPVFALCLALGGIMQHVTTAPRLFAWIPFVDFHAGVAWLEADPPAWSLFVEAWAMPFIPIIAWFGTGSLIRVLALPVAAAIIARVDIRLACTGCFMLGAVLSRWNWRAAPLETGPMQWLGKISYSLYLSHWLVLSACYQALGRPGVILGGMLAFPAAWCVWRLVEQPSIELSRRVGRLRF
jgi:peptidoglycan/LPS O-acetylase OafA/YrhL